MLLFSRCKNDVKEKAQNGDKLLFTQTGMMNNGFESIGMNNAMLNTLGNERSNIQGSLGIKNDTNSFLRMLPIGDAGRYLLESLIPGVEPAQTSWEDIRDSGILNNGGAVIAHSQGADIVSNAFNNNDLNDIKQKANLLLIGGANGTLPVDSFHRIRDFRNSFDPIPGNPITGTRRLINGWTGSYNTSAPNYQRYNQGDVQNGVEGQTQNWGSDGATGHGYTNYVPALQWYKEQGNNLVGE